MAWAASTAAAPLPALPLPAPAQAVRSSTALLSALLTLSQCGPRLRSHQSSGQAHQRCAAVQACRLLLLGRRPHHHRSPPGAAGAGAERLPRRAQLRCCRASHCGLPVRAGLWGGVGCVCVHAPGAPELRDRQSAGDAQGDAACRAPRRPLIWAAARDGGRCPHGARLAAAPQAAFAGHCLDTSWLRSIVAVWMVTMILTNSDRQSAPQVACRLGREERSRRLLHIALWPCCL